MAFKVSDDHWAFLDEIEAPMWVDLNLESNSNDQNSNDDWFYTSHQFHQCSSSHLKSVFSHSGGSEITTLDLNLLGSSSSLSSSPKLPHSVSKSRGKQYRSEKWKWDNQGVPFDRAHPLKILTGKSLFVKLEPKDKVRGESSSVCLNEASTSSGKAVSNFSKPQSSSSENRTESLSSEAKMTSESFPTSGVTSDSGQERLKVEFGQTSELLLMMRKSIRKSYITRQAKRVEIKGRNSTSSKSSVGSSSNPRCDAKISSSLSARPKEITPDSRNIARISPVPKSQMNFSSVVNARPTIKSEEGASNNRRDQVNTAKQKVKFRDSRAKASVSSGVRKENSTVASTKLAKKPGTSMSRKLVCEGKENNVGERTSLSQNKSSVRGVVANGEGIVVRDRKVTMNQSLSKGKGKNLGNLEKPKSFIQRVHFR